MQLSSHLRGTVCELIESGALTGGPDEVRRLWEALGRVWQCTNPVPARTRGSAAEWLENQGEEGEKDAALLKRGCTYAQLARALRKRLEARVPSTPDYQSALVERFGFRVCYAPPRAGKIGYVIDDRARCITLYVDTDDPAAVADLLFRADLFIAGDFQR